LMGDRWLPILLMISQENKLTVTVIQHFRQELGLKVGPQPSGRYFPNLPY
jgi:hypothetical protein